MNEERYTRIEDYLDEQLDVKGRVAFESEVQNDPALAQLLDEVREARTRLARQWAQEGADHALATTLKKVGHEHFKQPAPKPPSARRRWLLIVLAAALLGLLAWLFWPAGKADLYAQYHQVETAAFSTRAANDPVQTNLANAEVAFNNRRYAEALGLLQRHLAQQPNHLEGQFYAAICQLELGQTQAAATAFRQLRENPAYTDEATWYLAMTFLKENNDTACASILRQIPPGTRYFGVAQGLLGELGRRGR